VPPYSLMIQWDDRAATFVAHVPELEYVAARGSSYEDVAANAEEAIASKVLEMRSRGESLPLVNTYSLSLVTANA
jgi:predicted RNase H-like HicB family nuclease